MTSRPADGAVPSSILIVDGDVVSRTSLRITFATADTEWWKRPIPRRAVDLGEPKLAIDVVLCDVSALGSRDGFQLASWAIASPELEVQLAGGVEMAAETAARLCASGPHLARPYEPDAVVDYVKRLRASRVAGPVMTRRAARSLLTRLNRSRVRFPSSAWRPSDRPPRPGGSGIGFAQNVPVVGSSESCRAVPPDVTITFDVRAGPRAPVRPGPGAHRARHFDIREQHSDLRMIFQNLQRFVRVGRFADAQTHV